MRVSSYDERIRTLAEDLHCGMPLVRDLLALAGNDVELVRKASDSCHGIESVKAYIIDARFQKNGMM